MQKIRNLKHNMLWVVNRKDTVYYELIKILQITSTDFPNKFLFSLTSI